MIQPKQSTPDFFLILCLGLFLILVFPPQSAKGADADAAAILSEPDIALIDSSHAMSDALNRLHSQCLKAIQGNGFSWEFQEDVLKILGKAINRIVELERHTDPSKITQEFEALFIRTGEILGLILTENENIIIDLQENKLDKMEDVDAFFQSPGWKKPQRLILLSKYWRSWNQYYMSLLYGDDQSNRKKLLEHAVEGFTLSLFEIDDQALVRTAIFGRALCYKEMKDYPKAIRDFDSLLGKVRSTEDLYIWSQYEKAVISNLKEDFAGSLNQLEQLTANRNAQDIAKVLGNAFHELWAKNILNDSARKFVRQEAYSKTLCIEALQVYDRITQDDFASTIGLYHLVDEYEGFFEEFSFDEMGIIGNLVLAEQFFETQSFQKAAKRYNYLCRSSHPLISAHLDELCFRSAYAYFKTNAWESALTGFEHFHKEFIDSDYTPEAACLRYHASATFYKENSGTSAFKRHIKAIKIYLKWCNNPEDSDEARFQLAKYYQDKGKKNNAKAVFSKIDKSSPRYWPARYLMVLTVMEELELLHDQKKGDSSLALKRYGEALSNLKTFQELPLEKKAQSGAKEVSAHMTLLLARLYSMYGPKESGKEVLKVLKDFEIRFPHEKKLWLTATDLRMKCYFEYELYGDAAQEIHLALKNSLNEDLWLFMNRWARKYYEKASQLRVDGDLVAVNAHAEIARTLYEEISRIASEHAPYNQYFDTIQLRLADIAMDEKQIARARGIYLEYLKRNPDSADALYGLGTTYEKENKWNEALEVWRKFTEGVEPGSPPWFESRFKTAVAYHRMGNSVKACEIVTMAQVLHPGIQKWELADELQKLKKEVCPDAVPDKQ